MSERDAFSHVNDADRLAAIWPRHKNLQVKLKNRLETRRPTRPPCPATLSEIGRALLAYG